MLPDPKVRRPESDGRSKKSIETVRLAAWEWYAVRGALRRYADILELVQGENKRVRRIDDVLGKIEAQAHLEDEAPNWSELRDEREWRGGADA